MHTPTTLSFYRCSIAEEKIFLFQVYSATLHQSAKALYQVSGCS